MKVWVTTLILALTLALLGQVQLAWSQNELCFYPAVNYAAGLSSRSVFAVDLDGDGDQDLAVANAGGNVSVLKNNGDGTFAIAVNYAVGIQPVSVIAADFDGNGNQDLAVANMSSNNISVLINMGDGTFASAVNYEVGSGPLSVFAADVDGDGDQDLAAANRYSNNVSILKNNGNGTFASTVNYAVDFSAASVFAADLDGDGDQDLAVANSPISGSFWGGNVSILKNNGNGTFASAVNYAVGQNPMSVFAADVDGDGDKDLAVANTLDGNVSVLKNNGDGTFAVAINYAVGSYPCSIFAADLDEDGDQDLAVVNRDNGNVSILKNNGNATFASAVNYAVGSTPLSVFAADVDGNGHRDLAVANVSSNNISVLINCGQGHANQPPTAEIDSITPNPVMAGSTVRFQGHGTDSDGNVIAYSWRSSIDGQLSTQSSFSTQSLSVGIHGIYFQVQDDNLAWSPEISTVVNVLPDILTEDSIIIPYKSSGWKYLQVAHGAAPPDFHVIGFDDSQFNTGSAGFGGGCCCGMPYTTYWATNTELILRRELVFEKKPLRLTLYVTIDNDIEIFINGYDVTHGIISHGGCPRVDSYSFVVPDSVLVMGSNLLAARAIDWGGFEYVDIRAVATIPAEVISESYSVFPEILTTCPAGDKFYTAILRDGNGLPISGYDQLWLDFGAAITSSNCPSISTWPLVYPLNPSGTDGTINFAPVIGAIDGGIVTLHTPYGVLDTIATFLSFDLDGDMTVTQDDWIGDESNDYDRDGKTDWLDYNLFVQHLGHNCSTPDTSLHLVMQLYANPPSGYLSEGDTSEISLIITNYSQVVCTLTAVRFNYFGFNIGYDNWIPFDSLIESIPLGIGQSDTIGGIFIIPQGNHGCIEAVASVLNRLEKPRCQLNLDSQGENGGPTPGDSSLCEAAIGDAYGFPLRIHIEPSLPPGWRYTVNDTIYNEIGTLIMSVVPDENALPGESGSITAVGIDAYGNQVGSLICEYIVPEEEIFLADLACTDMSSMPDIPYGGQNTRVSGMVANQGDVPANMVIISLIDETLGTIIGEILIDQILPGQMRNVVFDWQPQCGQQAIRLVVDAEDEIAESDENNNSQLININPICQDDIYIISSVPTIEAEINDTIKFEITVINKTDIPQTLNLTLSEPVNQWISLSDNILWVPNGGSRTTAVTLITPNQCENLAGDYSIVFTATSDDPPIIKAHEVPLHISSAPIIHDLLPINGQTTASNDVTILWRTSTVSTSKVVYWIDGQSDLNEIIAASGVSHNVVLPDLLFNTRYYWYAESVSDCGTTQSEERSFIVGKGVVFTNSPYECFINRDYNQLVSISVKNEDDQAHTVLVEAVNPAEDLILGFLGSGSIDETLELNPGETRSIPLAIHAQDAMSPNYAISLRLISDGETSRPITDYTLAAIHINIPDIRFHFQEISYDTTSMVRTLQIVNDGDLLTDLKVEISQMEGIELLMQPAINHARLQQDQVLEFKVIPIFEESYAGPPEGSAVLAASAAEHVEYLPIDEVCTKQIFRATASNVIVTVGESAQATWYCTNRPHIRITLTFPSCSQLPKYVLLNSKFEPQVSNWDVKSSCQELCKFNFQAACLSV